MKTDPTDKLILETAKKAELELFALSNGLTPGIKNLNQDDMNALRIWIEGMERHILSVRQRFQRQIDQNLQDYCHKHTES